MKNDRAAGIDEVRVEMLAVPEHLIWWTKRWEDPRGVENDAYCPNMEQKGKRT